MDILGPVQAFVFLLLGLGALALTAFAFVDALRRRSALFPHAGRFSKNVWLGILGAALALAIVSFGNAATLGILNVVGVIAAAIYLADLRPKLRQLEGGRGSDPYGPY